MTERAYWIAWAQVPMVGAISIQRLQQRFGSLAAAWAASPQELEAVEGLGWQTAQSIATARTQIDPIALLAQHERENPSFWTGADPDYPQLLRELPDPPPVLYYRGQVNLLENQGKVLAVAIVGTRSPSDYGRRWTRRLSMKLAQAGYTIVSGLAEGIDTEAHQSCLSVGGRTIAALGTGVDVVYPWSNRSLTEQIANHGLLVSEYPAGTQPDRVNFPRRNRIIAGLARATLVLEAPRKSGALITTRLANDYNREVFALPGSLDNPKSEGCLDLISQGAQVILGEAQLLDLLKDLPHLAISQPTQLSLLDAVPEAEFAQVASPTPPIELEPLMQVVWQAVPLEPVPIDVIVEATGLSVSEVLGMLSQLELKDLVTTVGGCYQRARF